MVMSFSPLFDSRTVASKEQFDAWYAFQNGDVSRFRVKRDASWSAPFQSKVEGGVVGGLRFKRTTLDIPGDRMTTLHDKSAGQHHPPVYCLQGPTQGQYSWQLERSNQPGLLRPGTLAFFDPATVRGHFTRTRREGGISNSVAL
jgi:hypothetical protein